MSLSNNEYPRPDFQRSELRWKSLNGPWDFFFDDEDIGLTEHWQRNGLPSHTTLDRTSANPQNQTFASHAITQQIALEPGKLLKTNDLARDSSVIQHVKRKIQVPFVFQSSASGINERGVHEVLWYERNIEDPRKSTSSKPTDQVLLRFGAVDYEATVWVNGIYVGSHRGGHVPFDVDITESLDTHTSESHHRITVRVFDSAYDLTQPRGKQYWKAVPESIFYTPSGGIWQSVWLEVVPTARIADGSNGTVLKSNDISAGVVHAQVAVTGRRIGQGLSIQVECSFGGKVVSETPRHTVAADKNYCKFDIDTRITRDDVFRPSSTADIETQWLNGVALWTPEAPHLYDLKIKLFDDAGNLLDKINTSTGMRSLDWASGDGTLRLNGRPYFQALVLDQGYWRDTFMTPPSPDALKKDIELSKAMGFNGCRKHQKVEDPIFLHWADRLGFLVWGEMANAYQFDETYVERFNQEWIESVKRDINHPSIVAWTPVNESWGYTDLANSTQQRNHIRALYYMTKSLDDTRPINDNCGWEHVVTDLTTFHDYADGPQLAQTCKTLDGILSPKSNRLIFTPAIPGKDEGFSHKIGAPVLCTEFGGVNIAPKQREDGGERDWGYTTASDPEDLLTRFKRLVMGVVEGGHCCGFVYTQLTDIEQEVNGLYSFDRQAKLDVATVEAVMREAKTAYYRLSIKT